MKSVNYHLSSCRWTGKKERFPRNLWQKRLQTVDFLLPLQGGARSPPPAGGSKKSSLFSNLAIHEEERGFIKYF